MTPMLARVSRPGARFYLLASAPFLAVFLLVPASLYLHAGEDWDFAPRLLVQLAALGLALYLVNALLVRLLALLSPRAAALLACGLFALGLWIVLAHVYAPIAIGPLDGDTIESAEPLSLSVREAIFLLLAIVVLAQLGRGRWHRAAVVLSLALALIATGYLGVALSRSGDAYAEPGAAGPTPAAARSVYHFVLDEMQTDAFLLLLDDPDLRDAFRGFTLFRNNISNYRTTHTSSASYFTGTLYRRGGLGAWREAWKGRGLFQSLDDAGYRTWMYAPYAKWREAPVDYFWYMRDVYEHESGTANSDFGDFALVWLLSLVPNALTNEALVTAERWSGGLSYLFVGDRQPLTVPGGLNQVASIMMLEQARRHEDLRGDAGEYVYVHAILPHGPFVVDRRCQLIDRQASGPRRAKRRGTLDRAAYLEQGACALRLIGAFLDRLRQLGRYDPATIVIHADTGFGRGLLDPASPAADGPVLGYPPQQLVSMVNALLMIKRPDAGGDLEIVGRPTQLIDLYPTLVELLELPPPDYRMDGRSVFGDAHQDLVFAIDPKVRHGPNLIEVRVDRPDDIERSPLTVLGPAKRQAAGEEQQEER